MSCDGWLARLAVYATAALVAFIGIVLTAAAAFVPAMMLRRLPTAQLLAEE